MSPAKKTARKRAMVKPAAPPAETAEIVLERVQRKLTRQRGRAARVLAATLKKHEADARATIVHALHALDSWLGPEEGPEGEEE